MGVLDFEAYKKCTMETVELKKLIDDLLKMNAELEQKVNALYGAYETIKYSCEGQISIYGTELGKLRKHIEMLEEELRKKCE